MISEFQGTKHVVASYSVRGGMAPNLRKYEGKIKIKKKRRDSEVERIKKWEERITDIQD